VNIPVVLEPITAGFRATGGIREIVSAEGSTETDALNHLREEIQSHLATGARVVPLDVARPVNPWTDLIGMFDENDPMVQEWLAILDERRKSEADPWDGLSDTCSTPTS
jgi:hypothetical protein